MDLELKEFEEKINSITEQFMSLIDSNDVIEDSIVNKFESTPINFDKKIDSSATVFNTGFDSITIDTNVSSGYGTGYGTGSTFKLDAESIKVGGIGYENYDTIHNEIPSHGIRFDSVEQTDLNKKLNDLYESKSHTHHEVVGGNPVIAFSDSNIGRINSYGYDNYSGNHDNGRSNYSANHDNGHDNHSASYDDGHSNYSANHGDVHNNYGDNHVKGHSNVYENYTKEKTSSTLNNKEGYEMSEYNGEEKKENVFYSFATIPAEKSLVEKKNWKETLFMDIPWDTKIDIWGGIKKLCTAKISITFN